MRGDRWRLVAARRGRIQRLRRFPRSRLGYARIHPQKIMPVELLRLRLWFFLLQQPADNSAELALVRYFQLIQRRLCQTFEPVKAWNIRDYARTRRRSFDAERQASALAKKGQLRQLRQWARPVELRQQPEVQVIVGTHCSRAGHPANHR